MKCRVREEWHGHFIGRRTCSTHGTRWDSGGPCPMAGVEVPKVRRWALVNRGDTFLMGWLAGGLFVYAMITLMEVMR